MRFDIDEMIDVIAEHHPRRGHQDSEDVSQYRCDGVDIRSNSVTKIRVFVNAGVKVFESRDGLVYLDKLSLRDTLLLATLALRAEAEAAAHG